MESFTGRRPLSSGGSRSESAFSSGHEEEEKVIDFHDNPEVYFTLLTKLQRHADRILQKEDEEEMKLQTYLTLVERSNLNKEGKVLTRWQERQREWEKVQNVITKKISSKISRPLMMATTDEYRARMEEYDLIQAAIPPRDRYTNSAWEMSLRGGGPVRVAVGHIFSGLECEIDPVLPKPKIVRKPKDLKDVWSSDTFVPQTEAYKTKRRQYQESIREMRPRDITFKDTAALVIKSVDLFQWAKDSSRVYLENLAGQYALEREEEMSVESKRSQEASLAAETLQNLPKIELLSSTNILFDTTEGVECKREVVFKNIGHTAVYFRWKRLGKPAIDANVPNAKAKYSKKQNDLALAVIGVSSIMDNKHAEDLDARNHILARSRESFFCMQHSGELLPDEIASIPFVFRDVAGGGYYTNDWSLELVPEQTQIFYNQQTSDGHDNTVTTSTSIRVNLAAHCLEVDETMTNRLQQKISFQEEKNNSFLERVCKVDGLMPPMFFDIVRVRQMELLKQDTAVFHNNLLQCYETVILEHNKLAGSSAAASMLSVPMLYHLDPQDVVTIREALFPEETVEIFDEVDEENLKPSWDYDVEKLCKSVDNLEDIVVHVEQLEKAITLMKAALEKVRLKEERKAARIAAGDSDEEEEEEEEEEPDEEDNDRPPPPQHFLRSQLLSLRSRLYGGALQLITSPLPMHKFEQIVYNMWTEKVADQMDSLHDVAIQSAGLQDFIARGVEIPRLPSPFTPEGSTIWENAMKLTSPIPEPPPGTKVPKPAKNAPPPAAPVQQQVEFFYKEFYTSVRQTILSACEDMFGETVGAFNENHIQINAGHPLQSVELGATAVPRRGDIEDKVVLISFDGDMLAEDGGYSESLFPIQEHAITKEVAYLAELLSFEPKAIILLYESPANTIPHSLMDKKDLLQSLLEQKWADYQVNDRRTRKKMKQPQRSYKRIDYIFSRSCAELYVQMNSLMRFGTLEQQPGSNSSDNYFQSRIPLFVLENFRCPGVLPMEPSYASDDSGDESAPVYYGKSEGTIHNRRKWAQRRPFRLPVKVKIGKNTINQDVYCDSSAALRELFTFAAINQNDMLWIDSIGRPLIDPFSSTGKSFEELVGKRMVSPGVREILGWFTVLRNITKFQNITNFAQSGDADTETFSVALSRHLTTLFPQSLKEGKKPQVMVVIGGEIKADKLRVIDELLTMVDRIALVGEVALPFIALNSSIHLLKHEEVCVKYKHICSILLRKARMCGCILEWPKDLLIGDEALTTEQKVPTRRLESRSDGTEYEAEVKAISVSIDVGANDLFVRGYAYDIGPATINSIKDSLLTVDLMLLWGVCGAIESSAFQTGTQSIIESMSAIVKPSIAAYTADPAQAVDRKHVILLGKSTVEWTRRLLDSDGDMQGDLVGSGLVTLLEADSSLLASLLGGQSSEALVRAAVFRVPEREEWVYSKMKLEQEDEEEDEEDEEEEEEN
eukprot:scaffold954_cov173-Ochromonas_danica.AAC.32